MQNTDSISDLERRISESSDNTVLLNDILKELNALKLTATGTSRWKAANLVVQIKAKISKASLASEMPNQNLAFSSGMVQIVKKYGVSDIHGDWLYRYRLTSQSFELLRADILLIASQNKLDIGWNSGLFVLWAAEWFRREYKNRRRKWEDIETALNHRADQNFWRRITDRGLLLWKRKAIEMSGMEHRLLTLMREGGLPITAFKQHPTLQHYIERIIAGMLADSNTSIENGLRLARDASAALRESFRDEDFMVLCVDLARAIVSLRLNADESARNAGLPVSAWLEVNRPNWRDSLPISTEEAAAKVLIDGLMTVAPQRLSFGEICVLRGLSLIQGVWCPTIKFNLLGQIAASSMPNVSRELGRLRAFATDRLAHHVSAELGIFHPPAEGDAQWQVDPSRTQTRSDWSVPLDVEAAIELRSSGEACARFLLPGGQAIRSKLLVCELMSTQESAHSRLKIVGTGSGKFRADTLLLHIPDTWTVRGHGEDSSVEKLGTGIKECTLWRCTGIVFVESDQKDIYRVAAGQTVDRRDELHIEHSAPAEFVFGTIFDAVVTGPPKIILHEGQQRRYAREGEIFFRPRNGKYWQRLPDVLPFGAHDIAWRDSESGHIRDRRVVLSLPNDLRVTMRQMERGARYQFSGRYADKVNMDDQSFRCRDCGAQLWEVSFRDRPKRFVSGHINFNAMDPIHFEVNIPSPAGIARHTGEVVSVGSTVSLDDLRSLIAFDSQRGELMAKLVLPKHKNMTLPGGERRWRFDQEMPFSTIARDLAAMIAPEQIDAKVELMFNDGKGDVWHVSQFGHRIKDERNGYIADPAVSSAGAALVVRPFADPTRELEIQDCSLEEQMNHRPILIPETIEGAHLIYLRRGTQVISRPIMREGTRRASPKHNSFAAAMIIHGQENSREEMDRLFETIEKGGQGSFALIRELIDITISLRGLPPKSLDLFWNLARHPFVLARMALHAGGDERNSVLMLSESLAFDWCLFETEVWDKAGQALRDFLELQLAAVPDFVEVASKVIAGVISELCDLQPMLSASFNRSAGDISVNIEAAANGFLIRSADKVIGYQPDSRYRAKLQQGLPDNFARFNRGFLEILDTPCAAASAACGQWKPDKDDVRHIKSMARIYPNYFYDGYINWYKVLKHG